MKPVAIYHELTHRDTGCILSALLDSTQQCVEKEMNTGGPKVLTDSTAEARHTVMLRSVIRFVCYFLERAVLVDNTLKSLRIGNEPTDRTKNAQHNGLRIIFSSVSCSKPLSALPRDRTQQTARKTQILIAVSNDTKGKTTNGIARAKKRHLDESRSPKRHPWMLLPPNRDKSAPQKQPRKYRVRKGEEGRKNAKGLLVVAPLVPVKGHILNEAHVHVLPSARRRRTRVTKNTTRINGQCRESDKGLETSDFTSRQERPCPVKKRTSRVLLPLLYAREYINSPSFRSVSQSLGSHHH